MLLGNSAVEALQAAKKDPGTILTNDLRFNPAGHLWLPLLNVGFATIIWTAILRIEFHVRDIRLSGRTGKASCA